MSDRDVADESPESFTLHEAAERLGLHYMTVYRHVRNGRLSATKGRRGWEVSAAALADYSSDDVPDPSVRQRRFEDRLVAHDDAAVWRMVQDELATGTSAADVLATLIVPSLRSIGERWQSGDLTVLDEHQATAAATVVIARLGPHIRRTPAERGLVVIGAPSGDTHALGPTILSDLLRAAGFETVDLGANTPAESFAEIIERHETTAEPVRGVAITVRTAAGPGTDTNAAIADAVAAIRATGSTASIAVGGPGTDGARAEDFGCDQVTSDLDEFVASLAPSTID